MLPRPVLLVSILAAAAGVPYVLMHEDLRTSAQSAINRALGRTAADDQWTLPSWNVSPELPWSNAAQRNTPHWTEDPPVADFSEVFRLEITPAWVAHRWSRVTTVTAEAELLAMRIPLVTGPQPDDLAGSLTYYFDKKHQLQRITFYGHTGDPRRLIALATGPLKMQPTPTLSAALLISQYRGKPHCALRITHLPVLRTSTPNHRSDVALELNRPSGSASLSQEMRELLDYDRAVKQW